MTKPIFLKDGKWQSIMIEDPDEIRYIEIYDEHIPLDVGIDFLVKEHERGRSFSGSCGIKGSYPYTKWASGMSHEKEEVIEEY